MSQRTPARKVLTVAGAVAVAGVVLWMTGQVFLMSGTKASFSFVAVKAAPAGGPGGATSARTTTTTTTGTAKTTAATTATTTTTAAATGGR